MNKLSIFSSEFPWYRDRLVNDKLSDVLAIVKSARGVAPNFAPLELNNWIAAGSPSLDRNLSGSATRPGSAFRGSLLSNLPPQAPKPDHRLAPPKPADPATKTSDPPAPPKPADPATKTSDPPAPPLPAPQPAAPPAPPLPASLPASLPGDTVWPSTYELSAITLGGSPDFFNGTLLYTGGGLDAVPYDQSLWPVEASFETQPPEGTVDTTPETVTLGEYLNATNPRRGKGPLLYLRSNKWIPGDAVTASGAERILGGAEGGDQGGGAEGTSIFTLDAIAPTSVALGVGGLAGALMNSNPVATAAGTGIGALGGHLLWKYLSENKEAQSWINNNLWDGAGEHMQYIAPALGGLAGLFLSK